MEDNVHRWNQIIIQHFKKQQIYNYGSDINNSGGEIQIQIQMYLLQMDMACEYIIQYIISSNTRLSLLTPCIFQCGCRYGDKEWSVCEPCQAIHEPQCDLSQETSDPRQWYYARVQARSSKGLSPWVTSTRLYPQWDSECQTYCVSPVLCGS